MSWRKDEPGERDAPRGYHHGNLREALIRAALELIARKGTAGFTFAEAARFAGVSPAAPYRHFRDRDELMANVALRGFEQFALALARAWDEDAPTNSLRWTGSARPISNSPAQSRRSTRRCSKPAFPSAPIPRCGKPAKGPSPYCAAPPTKSAPQCPRPAPAGLDGRAPHLDHGAWRRFAVRTRRRRATRVADVACGTSGSGDAGLFARARSLMRRGREAGVRLDNWRASYVNVHYIHKRGRAMPIILTVLGFMWWWPIGTL